MDSLRRLATSVLIQAYRDATKGTSKERHAARQWLTDGNEHFVFWCELADLDPGLARRAVINELARTDKSGTRIRILVNTKILSNSERRELILEELERNPVLSKNSNDT